MGGMLCTGQLRFTLKDIESFNHAGQNRKVFSQYSRLSFSALYRWRIWRFVFHLLLLRLHKTAADNMSLHELENFRWLGPTWSIVSGGIGQSAFAYFGVNYDLITQNIVKSFIQPSPGIDALENDIHKTSMRFLWQLYKEVSIVNIGVT